MKKIIAILACMIALTSCTKPKTNDIIADIANKQFILTNMYDEATITFAMDSGLYYGSAGVNNYSGEYKVGKKGDVTLASPNTTRMSGPQELMALEREFLADLHNVASITIASSLITIRTTDGKILRFKPTVRELH